MNKEKQHNYPKLESRILDTVLPDRDIEPLNGDFLEIYSQYREKHGFLRARLWLWKQIFQSVPLFIINSIKWSYTMFRNYFKISIRNIKKQKGYSFLNIAGFSISMACSLLILLYVLFEFSFDRYHKNAERIYRILLEMSDNKGSFYNAAPEVLVNKLKEEIPEVEKVTRFLNQEEPVKYNNMEFIEKNIYYGDPELFEIFSFSLLSGSPEVLSKDPFSLLVTEETAKRFFGTEDPIGKVLIIGTKEKPFTITGVIKNLPYNSQFRFDFLASINALDFVHDNKNWRTSWGANYLKSYILVGRNINPDIIEEKFQSFTRPGLGGMVSFHIEPLTKIHFFGNCVNEGSDNEGEYNTKSDIKYIYIFSSIAIFILFLAVTNYMNLTTARYTVRVKEIGIRKIVGANKNQLIRQFIIESFLFSLIAMIVSLIIVYWFLPHFNTLINRNISLSVLKYKGYLYVFGIFLLIGLGSGAYPAFFLSAFQPLRILKGNLNVSSKGSKLFRNYLVTIQFIISIVLISGTVISINQLKFMKDKDLGYDKEFIINVPHRMNEGLTTSASIKNQLLKYHNIKSVSVSTCTPTISEKWNFAVWEGQNKNTKSTFCHVCADPDFFKVYNLKIIEGQESVDNLSTPGYYLNETAVKLIGWEEPVGKSFGFNWINGNVLGVVKDFHFKHLGTKIEPLAIVINQNYYFALDFILSVKINSNNIQATLNFIKKTWKEFTSYPFEFTFVDDQINRMYRDDRRLISIFQNFTLIAIIITGLGLFGLTSFTAARRSREISIRKVFGASVRNILVLLFREFFLLIIIAFFIAMPITYFAIEKWLQNYAYRVNIGLLSFILSGFLIFLVAILTISFKSLKAAAANPVESIRNE